MIRTFDAKLALFEMLDPALVLVIDESLEAWAAADERGIICFYGYRADVLGDEAAVWFHPHRPLDEYKITALRRHKHWIEDLLHRYKTLYATVDTNFAKACRWLEWLGFVPTDRTLDVAGTTARVLIRQEIFDD